MTPVSVLLSLLPLMVLPPTIAQLMTECERGVKRAHSTQENIFQVLVRTGHTSDWLDQACPSPQVFNPKECACVVPLTSNPKPPPTFTSPPTQPAPRSPWFSRSKLMKKKKMKTRKQMKGRPGPSPTLRQGEGDHVTSVVTLSPWAAVNDKAQVQAPVTEAQECLHFRATESGSGEYEQWTEGGWVAMSCNWPVNSGLVWSQDLCRCDWGPNPVLPQPDLDSVPAVCLMMLKITFDEGEIKDVGRDLWLDLRHPYSMEAQRDDTAVGGWAGAFRGTGISVPFFKMNTLGSTFRIQFRFRLCDGRPDTDLLLLNNGCVDSEALPSLQVSYRAWANVLAFQMATVNSLGPYREECHVQSQSEDPWTDVNIHYDEDTLEIFVNGIECVRSAAFTGPIVQTDCPLTLLEDNFCGLLDEVVITRGCTPLQES